MTAGEPEATPRERGAWRLTAVSIAAVLLVVPGLFLGARNAPSARSNSPEVLLTPVVALDEGCQNFAAFWLQDSGLTIDPSVIEGMTNCRRAKDGTWIVPTGPGDPRLASVPIIPEEHRDEVRTVEAELRGEIAAMEGYLSPQIARDMRRIYSPRALPVTGNIKDNESIGRARSRYGRVVQAYLLAPQHRLLADYVAWVMARRQAAYDALEAACTGDPDLGYLTGPCLGLEEALSLRYPPWPWELRSALTMREFLADRLQSGELAYDVYRATRMVGWNGSQ